MKAAFLNISMITLNLRSSWYHQTHGLGLMVCEAWDNGENPISHEALHIGQRLFAALTHNEIAHLLEVLFGTLLCFAKYPL